MRSSFSRFAVDAVYPYAAGGPNMSFAFLTQYYMRIYGAEPADFGRLCVAQRANALKNPLALFKKPLTLDEYLSVVEQRFNAANPDKDGTLDAKELNARAGRALLRLLR